jgi:transcriptional regulator with XRE-family HTH domain
MIDHGKFIEIFEKLMKNNSISQKELAGKIGLRRPSISEWKKKRTFPYVDVAIKIAEILNVSVEYLVTGEDGLSADERELLTDYLSLNDDGKKAARSALKGFAADYPKKGKESASLTA